MPRASCGYYWMGRQFFTWLVRRGSLPGEDHRHGSVAWVLRRVESNLALRGWWPPLAFLSEITKDLGRGCEAAVAEKQRKERRSHLGQLLRVSRNTPAFLQVRHLLSRAGWPADGKACFLRLQGTPRSLGPLPCLQVR